MEQESMDVSNGSFMGLGELITTVAQVVNDYGWIGVGAVALVVWVMMGRPSLKAMLGKVMPEPSLTAADVATLMQSRQMPEEIIGETGPMVTYAEFNTQMQRIEKENRAAHKDMFVEVRKLGEKIDHHFEKHSGQIAQFREENRVMLDEHTEEDEKQFKDLKDLFTKQDKTLAVWEDRWAGVRKRGVTGI